MINYVEGGYSTKAPSPVISINDEPVANYLLRVGVETQQYLDPDALYNLVLYSIPLSQQSNGNAYKWSGHIFGFSSEETTYQFANGTSLSMTNIAVLNKPFEGMDDGTALFNLFEVPVSTTSGSDSGDASDSGDSNQANNTTPLMSTTVSTVSGYPTPVVLHKDGYTGGYFLNGSTVAVLAMTSFADPTESEEGNIIQQTVIRQFLADCKAAGMTKLIVDLQGNGGGH